MIVLECTSETCGKRLAETQTKGGRKASWHDRLLTLYLLTVIEPPGDNMIARSELLSIAEITKVPQLESSDW